MGLFSRFGIILTYLCVFQSSIGFCTSITEHQELDITLLNPRVLEPKGALEFFQTSAHFSDEVDRAVTCQVRVMVTFCEAVKGWIRVCFEEGFNYIHDIYFKKKEISGKYYENVNF